MQQTTNNVAQNTSYTTSAPVSKSSNKPRKKPRPGQEAGETKPGRLPNQLGGKLRGLEKDSPEVRISKTLSWLLRHGAKGEGLPMRSDGYVKVTDLLANRKLSEQPLNLVTLQEIVKADSKQRYDLILEDDGAGSSDPTAGVWWMRARQGHSMKTVKIDMQDINSVTDIPTGVAVHGTTVKAWQSISTRGLSKMTRNHIHLAQAAPGDGVISGMRNSSQILVFIDVQKALNGGIKFFLSDNGVVLTEGNQQGFLSTEFFKRVENAKGVPLPGWEGMTDVTRVPADVQEATLVT